MKLAVDDTIVNLERDGHVMRGDRVPDDVASEASFDPDGSNYTYESFDSDGSYVSLEYEEQDLGGFENVSD